MKSETVMLGSLFAACLLVCTLVLGSMFTLHPASPHALAATNGACATTAMSPACPSSRG